MIDFDVGLRNLDLIMGVERRVVYDFVNVINGEASLKQALIKDKRVENLYILPASQTRDKDALTKEGVGKVIDDLKAMDFEYIICDSPAGIEQGALMALYYADEAIITTNPEVSSVRDSDRILGILASKSRRAERGEDPVTEHLVITRYNPGTGATAGNALGRRHHRNPLHQTTRRHSRIRNRAYPPPNQGVTGHSSCPDSQAGQAYSDLVERFLGKDLPHRFLDANRKGIFSKLFGG